MTGITGPCSHSADLGAILRPLSTPVHDLADTDAEAGRQNRRSSAATAYRFALGLGVVCPDASNAPCNLGILPSLSSRILPFVSATAGFAMSRLAVRITYSRSSSMLASHAPPPPPRQRERCARRSSGAPDDLRASLPPAPSPAYGGGGWGASSSSSSVPAWDTTTERTTWPSGVSSARLRQASSSHSTQSC